MLQRWEPYPVRFDKNEKLKMEALAAGLTLSERACRTKPVLAHKSSGFPRPWQKFFFGREVLLPAGNTVHFKVIMQSPWLTCHCRQYDETRSHYVTKRKPMFVSCSGAPELEKDAEAFVHFMMNNVKPQMQYYAEVLTKNLDEEGKRCTDRGLGLETKFFQINDSQTAILFEDATDCEVFEWSDQLGDFARRVPFENSCFVVPENFNEQFLVQIDFKIGMRRSSRDIGRFYSYLCVQKVYVKPMPGRSLRRWAPPNHFVDANGTFQQKKEWYDVLMECQKRAEDIDEMACDDERACVVCQDNKPIIALFPCRHMCLCAKCGFETLCAHPTCPKCRGEVKTAAHMFY